MKSTSAILFVIFLSILKVDVRASQLSYNPSDYDEFLQRLGENVPNPFFTHFLSIYELPTKNILSLQEEVVENVKKTSDKFKELCVRFYFQLKQNHVKFAAAMALNDTIKYVFDLYKKSAKENKYMLNYLEILDPIGFSVYLAQKNVNESSSNFVDSVEEFQTIILKEILLTDEIQSGFKEFLNRLEKGIVALPTNILPFTVKENMIEKLKQTSDKFKFSCYKHDSAAISKPAYSPLKSLNKVIKEIFDDYKESAKENRDILNDIECVDPIGLNVYLTKKNVKNSSPDFIQSVTDFRTAMYKKLPIIARSSYSMNDFFEFSQRIKTIIENPSSTAALPFTLQINVVANLGATTDEFKNLCAQFEDESKRVRGNFSPVSSLNRTIQYFFDQYKLSAEKKKNIKMLNEIQSVDPIGLNIHLKDVNNLSPNFIQVIEEFHATMLDRVKLFESRKSDLYIESLKKNRKTQLHNIPENIREEITAEYKSLNHETINNFIEIASTQLPNIKMYPVDVGVDKFRPHNSTKTNDVQVLYDGEVGSKEPGHAICIYFETSSQNVFVYDSLMKDKLEPRQEEIIRKLYPHRKDIIFQKPRTVKSYSTKTVRNYIQTDSIYAIMYATTLRLGGDPCRSEFKLNRVFGDETLYMRLHILAMFAKRKLSSMKTEYKIRSMISKITSPSCVHPKFKQQIENCKIVV